MSYAEMLHRLLDAQLTLEAVGDELHIIGDLAGGAFPPALRDAVRHYKPNLLARLGAAPTFTSAESPALPDPLRALVRRAAVVLAHSSTELRTAFEQRVVIMESAGCTPREAAELLAYEAVFEEAERVNREAGTAAMIGWLGVVP